MTAGGLNQGGGGPRSVDVGVGEVSPFPFFFLRPFLAGSDRSSRRPQHVPQARDSKVAAMTNTQHNANGSTVSSEDRRRARKELESAQPKHGARMAALQAEEVEGRTSVRHMVAAPPRGFGGRQWV